MSTGKNTMPIQDKYLLTCREASIYFNLGIKNMRSLARVPSLKIGVNLRGRQLIVRSRFEEYVLQLLEDKPSDHLSELCIMVDEAEQESCRQSPGFNINAPSLPPA